MAAASGSAAMASSGDASKLARRSAESASGDASQLAGSSIGTVHMVCSGSFNVGIEQNMLTSKRCRHYIGKVEDVVTACVQDAGLHIMNLCEFGSLCQGVRAAGDWLPVPCACDWLPVTSCLCPVPVTGCL